MRHARKEGRSVAVLRAVDHGDSCVVETEVYPVGAANGADPVRPGPYTFANAAQATQFVTEAVEALMVLGCDVQAPVGRLLALAPRHEPVAGRVPGTVPRTCPHALRQRRQALDCPTRDVSQGQSLGHVPSRPRRGRGRALRPT